MLSDCNAFKIKYTSNQQPTQTFTTTKENNQKMAAQDLVKYAYEHCFLVSEVLFKKACTIAHNAQQKAYIMS